MKRLHLQRFCNLIVMDFTFLFLSKCNEFTYYVIYFFPPQLEDLRNLSLQSVLSINCQMLYIYTRGKPKHKDTILHTNKLNIAYQFPIPKDTDGLRFGTGCNPFLFGPFPDCNSKENKKKERWLGVTVWWSNHPILGHVVVC